MVIIVVVVVRFVVFVPVPVMWMRSLRVFRSRISSAIMSVSSLLVMYLRWSQRLDGTGTSTDGVPPTRSTDR